MAAQRCQRGAGGQLGRRPKSWSQRCGSWVGHPRDMAHVCRLLSTPMCLVLGLGLCYSINILPNHDAFESHRSVSNTTCSSDWGEVQARGTANFAGAAWSFLFGGINYQIEHHLFPTIHHRFYPQISAVVRATAAEYNVPYLHFSTPVDALGDVLAQFRLAAHSAEGRPHGFVPGR